MVGAQHVMRPGDLQHIVTQLQGGFANETMYKQGPHTKTAS